MNEKVIKLKEVTNDNISNADEYFLSSVRIGNLINEPAITIRNWSDKHCESLSFRIDENGKYKYSQASVAQFRVLKELIRNKNYTHKQVCEYITKYGFKIDKSLDEEEIAVTSREDPMQIEILTKKYKIGEGQLQELFTAFKAELIREVKTEACITLQEVLEENIDSIGSKIGSTISKSMADTNNELHNVSQQLNSIQENDAQDSARLVNIDEQLKDIVYMSRKERHKKQSLLSKIKKLFQKIK